MLSRAALLAVSLASGLATAAAGQGPIRGELGRFEVQGLDFRPDGAWRRRVSVIRAQRAELRRAGQFALLNAAAERGFQLQAPGALGTAVTGTIHVPVIALAYSDVPVAYPVSDFHDVLFSPDPAGLGIPYSVKSYYEELSNGLISMEGTVFDAVQLGQEAAYYQDNCNGIGVITVCPNGAQRFVELLIEALDAVSNGPAAGTVWHEFDNDGPDGNPNSGDDDGVVDFVSFLQPTVDGACGTPGIWAHRFVISGWTGSQYVTKTPRRDSNGQPVPGQFLRVDGYTIQSQQGGTGGCTPNQIMPIGTVAHETGHQFGLPDLYDTDATSRTEGVGEWSLMGSGNYTTGRSPASWDAWSLAEVGWISLAPLGQDAVITTGARQLTDTAFVIQTPTAGHYFLVANRQAVHSDTAQMNPLYGKRKTPGLLVWLIDEPRIAQGIPPNRVNTGVRQGVSLMQADGLNQLRTPGLRNRGDPGDPYPGQTGNPRFSLSSNPAARNNLGEYAGFVLDQIEDLGGGSMRFRVTFREPSVFSANAGGVLVRVNGILYNRLEEVFRTGEAIDLAADSLQLLNQTRTRAIYLAWSNGGPRQQQLLSGAVPDTVTAHFRLEHRLRGLVSGVGMVTATAPGDLTQGFYLDAGSMVTLTATAPAGHLFVRWEGDTASDNTALSLTMHRPFDLTAVFVQQRVVAVDAAADHLLGNGTLPAADQEFLDVLGNRNGEYDLGDYLALLTREGLAPPLTPPSAAGRRP